MVTYNPKDWFKLIFHFHRSDTLRILFPTMLLLGIITAGVVLLEDRYLNVQLPSLTIFHQIAGFIISLVLVFRINTAYDRWWEGRKAWGSLLNNARNLAIKLDTFIEKNDHSKRKEISLLIGNYAFALKEHLRNNTAYNEIEFTDHCREEDYINAPHKPNFIAARISSCVSGIEKVKADPIHYLILDRNVNEFTDICGICERIKNTPIPYSYSIFIKKIIFLYVITMPFTFGLSVSYWAIPIVMIMFYAFASLELLSEEIEDPFGTDANDLPTDDISMKVRKNAEQILLPNAGT